MRADLDTLITALDRRIPDGEHFPGEPLAFRRSLVEPFLPVATGAMKARLHLYRVVS